MRILLSEYKQSRRGLRKMLRQLDKRENETTEVLQAVTPETEAIVEDLHNQLRTIKRDRGIVNSMIRSVSEIIDWMESGTNPYYRQGISRRHNYDVTYLGQMDLIPDISEQLKEEREELKRLSKDEKELITKVLMTLTDRERECFILHVAAGHSMSETGEVLGIAKTTVQNHIEKARVKIKSITSNY